MIKRTMRIVLLGLMLVAGLVLVTNDVAQRHPPAVFSNAQEPATAQAPDTWLSEADADGPEGRRTWNVMRLADPATGRIPPDIRRREADFARTLPSRRQSALLEAAGVEPAAKMAGWQLRGPRNVGGRTRAFAIDVSDPTYATLLAGGVSGGMWRSTDDGASWTLTTTGDQLHSVTTVAQDTRPGHENVWYYGTGEYRGNSAGYPDASYRGDGLFKSTDGGRSWFSLPATAGADPSDYSSSWQFVTRVAIDPSNTAEDEVYAAIAHQIRRSVDGGASFEVVRSSSGSWLSDVVVSPSGVVYASFGGNGSAPGIYRSDDGLTWANITPWIFNYGRIVLALAPSDENTLYCLIHGTGGPADTRFYKYTYLSGDGTGDGGVWANRSTQMTDLPQGTSTGPLDTQSSYNMAVTVHPTNQNLVYVGGRHLYRSDDGFATDFFTAQVGGGVPDHHVDQHLLVFRPGSSSIAYCASDGGVHRTMDATADTVVWTPLNNGYTTSQFYAVAIDEDAPGSDVVIGGTQDNGSWFTNTSLASADWTDHVGGDGGHCAVPDAVSPTAYYLYSQQNGVMVRLTVDNVTGDWLAGTQYHPADGGNFLWINPVVMDPVENFIVYTGTSNGVWRQNDYREIPDYTGGPVTQNWDHLTLQPAGDYVSALAVSRSANRILYYGTASGRMYRLDAASTAPVPSAPTQLVMGPDFTTGCYVSSLAIHPDDDQQVLLGVSSYNAVSLFFTADGGATWENVEGNLGGADGPSIRDVAIVPVDALYQPAGAVERDVYFAATSTGVYSAVELAGSETVWRLEAPDLIGNVVVDALATRAADGTVVAATHGKGIYAIDLSGVAGADDGGVPGQVRLAQNAPNPFNPRTTIAFALPRPEVVTLTVHDIAGRLVRTLVADERLPAGRHEREWWGRDDRGRRVASGVYLYRLETEGHIETKRMTLLK